MSVINIGKDYGKHTCTIFGGICNRVWDRLYL